MSDIPTIDFEAVKVGYQQTKDGVRLVLVLHPNDIPDELALSPLGARYQCVLVRLGDDDQPQRPQEKQRSWHELRASQQAGIACNDPRFVDWCSHRSSLSADAYVREACGVKSRAWLDENPKAREAWKTLYARYRQETGLTPEVR